MPISFSHVLSSSLVPISMSIDHAIGRCRNGVHDGYLIEGSHYISLCSLVWHLGWISPTILHFCQLDHIYLFLLQKLLLVSMMLLTFMLSFYLLQFVWMPPWLGFHVHVEFWEFYFNCLDWCSWLLEYPYDCHSFLPYSSLYFLPLFLPLLFGFVSTISQTYGEILCTLLFGFFNTNYVLSQLQNYVENKVSLKPNHHDCSSITKLKNYWNTELCTRYQAFFVRLQTSCIVNKKAKIKTHDSRNKKVNNT